MDNRQTDAARNETAGDAGASLLSDAKAKVEELAEPLKEKALDAAREQKEMGADQIQVVARAVHGAAHELESKMPQFASYIHDTGTWLERTATDVRERNLDELVGMFSDFAKRQPSMVFGGAVLTGLALSRFLKSSASAETPPDTAATSQQR